MEVGKRLFGATYLHAPEHVFDARWVMTGTSTTDIKLIPGAAELYESLHTASSQDTSAPSLFPQLTGRDLPALSVKAIQLRITQRYAIRHSEGAAKHYIEFVRVIEPHIMVPPSQLVTRSRNFYTLVQPERKLIQEDGLWYEVNLGSLEEPAAFMQNETLELGGEASWTVDQIVNQEYERNLAELEALVTNLLRMIDHVGMTPNGSALRIENKIREEERKKQQEFDRAFTEPQNQW